MLESARLLSNVQKLLMTKTRAQLEMMQQRFTIQIGNAQRLKPKQATVEGRSPFQLEESLSGTRPPWRDPPVSGRSAALCVVFLPIVSVLLMNA